MNRDSSRWFSWFAAALLLLSSLASFQACSKTVVVTVPPRVDLKAYRTIGVVRFEVEGGALQGEDVTHRFLATLQTAQPGIRFLELGPEEVALRAVACQSMDLQAIRAIGREYGVDAVLTGELVVSEVKPKVSVGPNLASLKARASMNGSLQAKMRETSSGATVWTNGAHGTWNVAAFGLNARGVPTHAGLADPDEKQEQMLAELVRVASTDFRPSYERHKVSK
jgi:hypothetical protein